MSIFSVVSQHVDWLSQRYAVIAHNVANIDTPGFKSQQIGDFQQTLKATNALPMERTNVAHFATDPINQSNYEITAQKNSEVKNSGNDVSIDKEMQSIGDTSHRFATDMNLERTFQRMYISSLKG